jgi:N-acetylmuramoyl-L-alanine amidase
MREADLTLDICKRVQGRLGRKYLAVVRLAPRGELQERAQFANDCNADLFLSIHVNAGGGTGFESYIYPGAKERTRKLRDIIHNAIIALPIKDRGKKEKNFCVLRETVMPAVLLECLFIDNEKDAALLIDEVFRDKLANEVAWGIAQALELEEIGHAPCANCQQANELMMEVDRLRSENTKYRQAISAIRKFMAGLNY